MVGDDTEANAGVDFWGQPPVPEPVAAEIDAQDLEPQYTIPPISGFWRRLMAFMVDGLLLGVTVQLLAWPLKSFWFQIGPYGRIVGFMIALVYFGVMDSRVGNGQTPGKRLLGVAVRDRNGVAIGLGRSMSRTLIWVVPGMLNGWAVPVMANPVVATLASVILFGVGGAILVTLVFNRRTRQGFHDMLTGCYVLYIKGQPVEALPTAARVQWILSGAMILLALMVGVVSGVLAARFAEPLERVLALQRTLSKDERFFSVGVNDQTFYESGGDTSRALRIQVWSKGAPSMSERTEIINDVARDAIVIDDVDDYDLIRIDVTSAFDLLFATGHLTYGDGQTVDVWQERVAED